VWVGKNRVVVLQTVEQVYMWPIVRVKDPHSITMDHGRPKLVI